MSRGGADRPAHVLVVEDDPAIRRGLELNLSGDGHQVVAVGDGDTALAHLEAHHVDLVLLDIMLPGSLSGLGVVRQLREQGRPVSVILLSARGTESDVVKGLEAGADDYVVKPFRLRELLARVRTQLRRQPQRHLHSFGAVEVDLAQRRVAVDGEHVPLDNKAFGVLRLLVERRGDVLTRDSILAGVWGEGYVGTDRTVDNVITRLRQKLDTPGQPRWILTVRGVGYRLAPPETP